MSMRSKYILHPGANNTYMYNLHTVCKLARVNGALVNTNGINHDIHLAISLF